MRKYFFLLLSISFSFSQENLSFIEMQKTQEYMLANQEIRIYPKPRWAEMLTRVPEDILTSTKNFVTGTNLNYFIGATLSTVALIPTDQYLIDQSRSLGNQIGLSPDNKYGKLGFLKNKPENIGATFYLIGNGTTIILLSAGFITYGIIKNNYRAQATASGLMESLLVSGVFPQLIKRTTGRESPFIAIKNGNPGGDWNPFPSFNAYAKNTPYYDAMPSGHLTTIMAGLTIITTNYPEYKWIKPVGYSLIAAMCYQMMQSQVHWISDYPLALFIGYVTGKTIAKNRFISTKYTQTNKLKKSTIKITGSNINGQNLLGISLNF